MFSWLANNPDAALAIATVLGGWLGLTKKKADLGKLKEQLLARLRQEVLKLLDEHASLARAREALEWIADAALGQLGWKRNKAVDAIVEMLIEQALKEYSERLGPIVLKARMEDLVAALQKIPGAFEAEDPTVPLEQQANVEVIPRDGTETFTKPFAHLKAGEDK